MKTILIALFFAGSLAAQTLIPQPPPAPVPQGQRVADAMVEECNRLFVIRLETFKNFWLQLWENPTATPETILAGFGSRGRAMFLAAQAEVAWLEDMAEKLETTPAALLGDAKFLGPKLPVTINHETGVVTLQ